MSPGAVFEITGRPPDPDCLHCALVPVINAFCDAHPGKPGLQAVHELLQTAAEILASICPESHLRPQIDVALKTFARQALDAAEGFRNAGLIPGARRQ